MKEIISQYIAASPNKMITYAEYIELALYHPQEGYYMKEGKKIGREGDFYTSSNVSNIYGKLIGKWYAKNAASLGLPPAICEIGAGNGRFARAFIQGWNDASKLMLKYHIVEASPFHKELQREELQGIENVEVVYAKTFADTKMKQGLIFSNELFDAFPVHVIEKKGGVIQEVFVALENGDFIENLVPLQDSRISAFLREQDIQLEEGQRMEIPLAMEPFIESISHDLSKGLLVTVDYGYTKEQWKEPARKKGSLRGYYRHQMHNDVLKMPGEMDITTHVHLDAIISIGEKYGLEFLQKKRQDEFLISIGILEELAEHNDPNPFSEASKRNRAIRSLILPGSISQSFDVIVQGMGLEDSARELF
jgi:SAM-dependent MidA family methyltransferase